MSTRQGRTLLGLLVAIVILVKAFVLLHTYHFVTWDEAVFLGMGKWIFSGGEIGIWENIRPLGLPLLLGIVWLLGSEHIMLSAFMILLFTIGVLILTYLVAERLFGHRVAIVAAVLTYITPVIFYYSNRILTGIPSLFFCLAALYCFIRRRLILAAILCFTAFFFRYPAGLIFVVVQVLLFIDYYYRPHITRMVTNLKKDIWPLLQFNLTFALLMILYFILNKLVHGAFLEPLLLASQHQSTFAGNVYGIDYLVFYPLALITSNALFLFALFIPLRKKNILYVLIPFLVFFGYFESIPHKTERFLLIVIPYLAILAAVGIVRVWDIPKKSYYNIAFVVGICILAALIPCIGSFQSLDHFPDEKPDFIDSYHTFFADIDFNGTIFTSDPVPAAYTDHRYLHFYASPDVGLQKLAHYEADAYIYSPEAFPWNDTEAKRYKKRMLDYMRRNAELVHNATVYGQQRNIYLER